ncbi:hypothetical protein HHK36_010356 [Tetracentron sinense]|uniref:Uncharacterized protein n=1 Tax=Tetracentron sinense TaxID=13715 RepID=A0A834ZGT1_TETSI|nr:hypothetical protein HHK36_010356 [Tetracentron sinense]
MTPIDHCSTSKFPVVLIFTSGSQNCHGFRTFSFDILGYRQRKYPRRKHDVSYFIYGIVMILRIPALYRYIAPSMPPGVVVGPDRGSYTKETGNASHISDAPPPTMSYALRLTLPSVLIS